MHENDQEKKHSYVEAVELFDNFDNFNRLRPESPKGRYVYYCVGLFCSIDLQMWVVYSSSGGGNICAKSVR